MIICYFAANVANAFVCPMMQQQNMQMSMDSMQNEHCENQAKKQENTKNTDCKDCTCKHCMQISLIHNFSKIHEDVNSSNVIYIDKNYAEISRKLLSPPPNFS